MARNVYNVDETLQQEFNFKHLKRLFGYLKPHRKHHHTPFGQGDD